MNLTTPIETHMTIIDYSKECKITIAILCPIFILLTILLHGGFIYFEKFGHDPLKRNLSNMLMSTISKSLLIIMVPYTVIGAFRMIFGPISMTISISFQFYIQCCITYCSLSFIELIVYKILVYFPRDGLKIRSEYFTQAWSICLSRYCSRAMSRSIFNNFMSLEN